MSNFITVNILKSNFEKVKKELEKRGIKFEVLGDGFNVQLDGAGIEDTIWERHDMFRLKIEGMSGNQFHKFLLDLGITPQIPW